MTCLHAEKIMTPSGCVCQECGLLFSSETVVDALAQNSRVSHKRKKISLRHVKDGDKPTKEKENFAYCAELMAQCDATWKRYAPFVQNDLDFLNFPKNQSAPMRYALALLCFYSRRVCSIACKSGFEEFRLALCLKFETIINAKRLCDFKNFTLADEMAFLGFEIDVVFHQFEFEPTGHDWIIRLYRLIPRLSCEFDASAIKMATLYFLAFQFEINVEELVSATEQRSFMFKTLSLVVLKLTCNTVKFIPFTLHYLPSSTWDRYNEWKEDVFNFLEQDVSPTAVHQLERFFFERDVFKGL